MHRSIMGVAYGYQICLTYVLSYHAEKQDV